MSRNDKEGKAGVSEGVERQKFRDIVSRNDGRGIQRMAQGEP